MPIYAYKCQSCGFAKDVLQKISDQPLSECPSCGTQAFTKQLTAAGFQLKGSGWYATDFKGGGQPAAPADGDKSGKADTSEKGSEKPAGKTEGGSGDKGGKSESRPADTPAAKKPDAPAATGSGG